MGARLRQSLDGDALYNSADCFCAGTATLAGIGAGSKIAIVFLGCFFPILINSYYGMRVVNRGYVELARSFRLSSSALFFKILLPASIPFILAGIRLAIGRGLTGVAIAEWFGATEGLGYLVYFAGQTLNIPVLFVGVSLMLRHSAYWASKRSGSSKFMRRHGERNPKEAKHGRTRTRIAQLEQGDHLTRIGTLSSSSATSNCKRQ